MKGKKREKKEKKEKKIFGILLRYFVLILFGFFIKIFYSVFTPSTIFFLKKTISIFSYVLVKDNIFLIITKNKFLEIEIIPACIAGSAYYLLLALNLLTPMKTKKRFLFIFVSFLLFFSFNLLRLFLLISLELKGIETFFYHKLLWYLGSTMFVFFIWLINIKIFKIREIPFVNDFMYLKKLSKKCS